MSSKHVRHSLDVLSSTFSLEYNAAEIRKAELGRLQNSVR